MSAVRATKAKRAVEPNPFDIPRFYEMTEQLDGEKQHFPKRAIPRSWQAAAKMLQDAKAAFMRVSPIRKLTYKQSTSGLRKRGVVIRQLEYKKFTRTHRW